MSALFTRPDPHENAVPGSRPRPSESATIDPTARRPAGRPARRTATTTDEARRLLLAMSFAVYLALLIWVVLWKLEPPHLGDGSMRRIKLVPFVSDGVSGPSAPLEVLANLAIFLPFGIHLALLAPTWPLRRAVAVTAATSLLLETAQYVLAVGSSDATDVIVNTAGGALGAALVVAVRRAAGARGGALLARVCAIATGAALVAAGLFAVSPMHYAQQDAGELGARCAAAVASGAYAGQQAATAAASGGEEEHVGRAGCGG